MKKVDATDRRRTGPDEQIRIKIIEKVEAIARKGKNSVTGACAVVGISRLKYYRWKRELNLPNLYKEVADVG